MWNLFKTTFLMALLTGVLMFAGRALGGPDGMVIAFLLATVMNFGAYWFSDKVLLRMYGAHQVTEYEAPELVGMVRDLAARGGLPMPKVYVIPQPTPNAFATGRNPEHAAVAVTAGILQVLSPDELRGVLAHELGHVRNRDILISTIAATMAGAISMLANMAQWALFLGGTRSHDDDGPSPLGALLTMILAPFAAMLIQFAISRSREYGADAYGAQLVGAGRPLARALRKLETASQRIPAHVDPSTAHLFIVNPLFGRGGLGSLFSTHPSTAERVKRLEAMDQTQGFGAFAPV